MSEAANTAEEITSAGQSSEPRPAPQWVLNTLRPTVGVLSRVLWRLSFSGVEHVPAEGHDVPVRATVTPRAGITVLAPGGRLPGRNPGPPSAVGYD